MKPGDGVPNQFPVGLRVFVIEDDPTFSRILEKMLKNCLYEVTKCDLAECALKLLRDNRDGYDIVITNIHMPDMDGFMCISFLDLLSKLRNCIVMSANDCKSVAMKGLAHGACDFLTKPVRIEELRNIWQHVLRKRISSSLSDDRDPRVVWSVELHQQFITVVNELGIDKVGPRIICESMNAPGLTREYVARHLQKYRLCFRKISDYSPRANGLGNSTLHRRVSCSCWTCYLLTKRI